MTHSVRCEEHGADPHETHTRALIAALSLMLAGAKAFALDPHVEAVIRTVEGANGKVQKTVAIFR